MIYLNIQNIEEFIFKNKKIHKILPEFDQYFKQWEFGCKFNMKHLIQNSFIHLLDDLEESHLNILSEYFEDKVEVQKVHHFMVQNINTDLNLEDFDQNLNYNNFTIFRDRHQLYLSMWR